MDEGMGCGGNKDSTVLLGISVLVVVLLLLCGCGHAWHGGRHMVKCPAGGKSGRT